MPHSHLQHVHRLSSLEKLISEALDKMRLLSAENDNLKKQVVKLSEETEKARTSMKQLRELSAFRDRVKTSLQRLNIKIEKNLAGLNNFETEVKDGTDN